MIDDAALRAQRLRRHPRRRPGLGEPAAAGAADLHARGARRRTSRWSARASPSTPAACRIKPGAGMATMKCDMAGAAAVVAATFAIAELGLPVRGHRPSCRWPRTWSSGDAHPARRRADDVRRHDRRGAQHRRRGPAGARPTRSCWPPRTKPDLIVDVATLTGACEIALGDRVAGIMGNDDALRRADHRAPARGPARCSGRCRSPEEMPVKVRTYSKVADLMQHNVDRVRRRAVRRGLPAGVRRRATGGPTSTSPARRSTSRAPYGHVASGGTGFTVSDAGRARRPDARGLSRGRSG